MFIFRRNPSLIDVVIVYELFQLGSSVDKIDEFPTVLTLWTEYQERHPPFSTIKKNIFYEKNNAY